MVIRNTLRALSFVLILFVGTNASAQSDDFGLTEEETSILTSFGDLFDMIEGLDVINATKDAADALYDSVEPAITTVQNAVTSLASSLGIQQAATNAFNSSVSALNSAISAVTDAVEYVEGLFDDFANGVGDFFEDVGDALCPFCMILADNGEPFAFEVADDGANEEPENTINDLSSMEESSAFSYANGDAGSNPLHPSYATSSFNDNYFFQNPIIVHPIFDGSSVDLDLSVFELDQLDNTADLEKPVSYLAQQALTQKAEWSGIPNGQIAQGEVTDMSFDENYLYICVASNQWSRIPLVSTWD